MLVKTANLVITKIFWSKDYADENGIDIADLPQKLSWKLTEDNEFDDEEDPCDTEIGICDSLFDEYDCLAEGVEWHLENVIYAE